MSEFWSVFPPLSFNFSAFALLLAYLTHLGEIGALVEPISQVPPVTTLWVGRLLGGDWFLIGTTVSIDFLVYHSLSGAIRSV